MSSIDDDDLTINEIAEEHSKIVGRKEKLYDKWYNPEWYRILQHVKAICDYDSMTSEEKKRLIEWLLQKWRSKK